MLDAAYKDRQVCLGMKSASLVCCCFVVVVVLYNNMIGGGYVDSFN